MSVRSALDGIEEQIVAAQRLLSGVQRDLAPGPSAGRGRQTLVDVDSLLTILRMVDDRLHAALTKLGD